MELFEEYVRDNPLSNKYLSNLIQKFVLSDAYRNSDNQAKAIENELNRAPLIEPEKQFRDAIDRCIRTARKVRDQILKAAPFYLPDSTVKPPPIEERIEAVVNPHQAGHCADLENLAKATKHFRPGKYPDTQRCPRETDARDNQRPTGFPTKHCARFPGPPASTVPEPTSHGSSPTSKRHRKSPTPSTAKTSTSSSYACNNASANFPTTSAN